MFLRKIKEKELNDYIQSVNTSNNNVFYISNSNKKQDSKVPFCTYDENSNKKIIEEEKSSNIPKNKTVFNNYNVKKIHYKKLIGTTFNITSRKKKNYVRNNDFSKKNNGNSKSKYIIETTKVEVFSPRSNRSNNYLIEQNALNSKRKLRDLDINRWNESICCSSIECLSCLGNDNKTINKNVYVNYL